MELVLFAPPQFALDQTAQALREEGLPVFTASAGAQSLPAEFNEAVLIFPEQGVVSSGEHAMRVREMIGESRRLIVCAPMVSPSDRKLLMECGATDVIAPRSWAPAHVAERIMAEMILAGRMQSAACGSIVGASAVMRKLYGQIKLLAPYDAPVLLLGETGTGKELGARAIHELSGRTGSFVPVNCAAIPAELIEAELFGHTRGAFTGARGSRAGLFETAGNGTIFLDEIGDLPLMMQPKLLRVLQEGTARQVGADTERVIRVRVVAATNRDLENEVSEGNFREDLYWRLEANQLTLPPLRERLADLPLLVNHFIEKFNHKNNVSFKAHSGALDGLFRYEWPGNIRQLESVVEKAAVRSDRASGLITAAMLQESINLRRQRGASNAVSFDPAVDTWEVVVERVWKKYSRAVLALERGNKEAAAKRSGLSRSHFHHKLKTTKTSDEPSD